jgi:hypothetical protein
MTRLTIGSVLGILAIQLFNLGWIIRHLSFSEYWLVTSEISTLIMFLVVLGLLWVSKTAALTFLILVACAYVYNQAFLAPYEFAKPFRPGGIVEFSLVLFAPVFLSFHLLHIRQNKAAKPNADKSNSMVIFQNSLELKMAAISILCILGIQVIEIFAQTISFAENQLILDFPSGGTLTAGAIIVAMLVFLIWKPIVSLTITATIAIALALENLHSPSLDKEDLFQPGGLAELLMAAIAAILISTHLIRRMRKSKMNNEQ